MDDIVIAALRKWPDVPACFGWLALDRRGDFHLRDAAAQAAGPFPQVKGSRIEHRRLLEFIGRNLGHDAAGAWYFQNGPQRVYLELEAAPLVAGVQRSGDAAWLLTSHLLDGPWQRLDAPQACWLDEAGRLFLTLQATARPERPTSAPLLALVRSIDMDAAADALEAGAWPAPEELRLEALLQRHQVQSRPTPQSVAPLPARPRG